MMNERIVQKGGALVETILLMLILLPILFGLVSTGNLIDLTQTTQQAARYATWQTTIIDPDQHREISENVSKRFFSAPSAPVLSTPDTISATLKQDLISNVGGNRLWGSPRNFRESSSSSMDFYVDSDEVEILFGTTEKGDSIALSAGDMAAKSGAVLQHVSGNEWGLSSNGVVSAVVKVPVDSDQLQEYGVVCTEYGNEICLLGTGAILNDSWSAADKEQMARRVRSLVPASLLEPVGNAVSRVGQLPIFDELKGLRGAFGYVNTDDLREYRGK